MKKNGKKLLILGTALLVMFVIWTCLIQFVCMTFEMIPINYRPILIDGIVGAAF